MKLNYYALREMGKWLKEEEVWTNSHETIRYGWECGQQLESSYDAKLDDLEAHNYWLLLWNISHQLQKIYICTEIGQNANSNTQITKNSA